MLCMAILAAFAGCDQALAEDTFLKSDTRQAVHQIQKRLMELGYTPGKVDGVWGQKTPVKTLCYILVVPLSVQAKKPHDMSCM